MGADGGIGGTYAVMPELILKINELVGKGEIERAREIQYQVNDIIALMVSGHANLYAVMKEVLRINENVNIGGVRKPLENLTEDDLPIAKQAAARIREAIAAL